MGGGWGWSAVSGEASHLYGEARQWYNNIFGNDEGACDPTAPPDELHLCELAESTEENEKLDNAVALATVAQTDEELGILDAGTISFSAFADFDPETQNAIWAGLQRSGQRYIDTRHRVTQRVERVSAAELQSDLRISTLSMRGAEQVLTILRQAYGGTPFLENPERASREFLVRGAREVNFPTDNYILLSAARASINLYNLEEDEDYLEDAIDYLEVAIRNSNTAMGFDNYRFDRENLERDTIHFVEAYFEIRVTQVEVLNILNPAAAEELSNYVMNEELSSLSFVRAMSSNPTSADGYRDRFQLLMMLQQLNQANSDLNLIFENSLTVADNVRSRRDTWIPFTWWAGWSHRDLRHDYLVTQLITAKAQMRRGREDETRTPEQREADRTASVSQFQNIFNSSLATRVYGGFMDLGLEAFFYLLSDAILNSESAEEAANRAAEIIDWSQVNSLTDIKENLGLVVRARDWRSYWAEITGQDPADPREQLSDFLLELGFDWAPNDPREIRSEIDISPENRTNLEIIDLVMRSLAIKHGDHPLVSQLVSRWERWRGRS